MNKFKFQNPITVKVEHADGTSEEVTFFNGMTDEGRQYVLDVALDGDVQISNWFVALIDNDGFTSLADADTAASHVGWTELTTYTEGTRPEFVKTRTGNVMSNPAPAVFNFTGVDTVHGVAIFESDVKGGATGKLWATALFPTPLAVSNGSVFNVTYSVEAI